MDYFFDDMVRFIFAVLVCVPIVLCSWVFSLSEVRRGETEGLTQETAPMTTAIFHVAGTPFVPRPALTPECPPPKSVPHTPWVADRRCGPNAVSRCEYRTAGVQTEPPLPPYRPPAPLEGSHADNKTASQVCRQYAVCFHQG